MNDSYYAALERNLYPDADPGDCNDAKVVTIEQATIEQSIHNILLCLGEDPTREGLKDTPRRYAKFLKQFLTPEPFEFTTFENDGAHEPIVVAGIPFYSMCEHHLAPFFGMATVGYIPGHRIVGLSKLPRAVKLYASRLQNQERIGEQIANALMDAVEPIAVGVRLSARHFCMEMRGIRTHGADTTTTAILTHNSLSNRDETRAGDNIAAALDREHRKA